MFCDLKIKYGLTNGELTQSGESRLDVEGGKRAWLKKLLYHNKLKLLVWICSLGKVELFKIFDSQLLLNNYAVNLIKNIYFLQIRIL